MQPTDVAVRVATGVRLRVRRWSAAAGPPFLLVHGLASNARLWDEVAAALATAGHPADAVDLRSHGESDAPPGGYDTATAAADLAAVCAELGIPPAIVVGQSWGGNVVVRLAAEHPDRVAALALVDGGWIDLSARFSSWEQAEAALRPHDLDGMRPEVLRSMIRRDHPGWSPTAVEATLASLRVTAGRLERRLAIDNHLRILRSMWDEPPWLDFAKIDVPVLLLPAMPGEPAAAAERRATVDRAASKLRQARIRWFVGADHDIHAQQPAALAAELLSLTGPR